MAKHIPRLVSIGNGGVATEVAASAAGAITAEIDTYSITPRTLVAKAVIDASATTSVVDLVAAVSTPPSPPVPAAGSVTSTPLFTLPALSPYFVEKYECPTNTAINVVRFGISVADPSTLTLVPNAGTAVAKLPDIPASSRGGGAAGANTADALTTALVAHRDAAKAQITVHEKHVAEEAIKYLCSWFSSWRCC